MTKIVPKIRLRQSRALKAKLLRQSGWTLREVANKFGYKSINSVVYLLKWYENQLKK